MDPYVRPIIPKVMFDQLRDSYRDLPYSGHKYSRRISPREYVAEDPIKMVLVTVRENATIARIGESSSSVFRNFLLKYSPFTVVMLRCWPVMFRYTPYMYLYVITSAYLLFPYNCTTEIGRVCGLYFGLTLDVLSRVTITFPVTVFT